MRAKKNSSNVGRADRSATRHAEPSAPCPKTNVRATRGKVDSGTVYTGFVRNLLFPLVLLAAACATDDTGPRRDFSTLDSAGIVVAASTGSAADLELVLVADPQPMLRIGARDGREELLFSDIRGLTRFPDGRIAVANGTPPEIRMFDDSGRFLARLGRRGRGPGEFSYLSSIIRGAGDTLLVVNNLQFHLLRFTISDGYADMRSLSRDSINLRLDSLRQVEGIREYFHDGSFVISTRVPSPDGQRPAYPTGELYRPTSTAIWISNDYGRSGVIAEFGHIQQHRVDLGGGRAGSVVPPSARWQRSARDPEGRRLCIAGNEQPEVHCVNADGTQLIVRWSQPEEPISDSAIAAWKEREREYARSGQGFNSPQDMEKMLAAAIIPPTQPPVGTVIVDTEGRILVGGPDLRTSELGRVHYRLFSAEGEPLGVAELPTSVIREIGDDYLLAVARDPDGVEFVEMYRLRRPSPQLR